MYKTKESISTKEPPTVEEYAKTMKTPASVLAAVVQSRDWAAGKRISAEEFKTAVEAFLKAP
jgi:hypothetical protein